MTKVVDGAPTDVDLPVPATGQLVAREQAIKQIERKRHFRVNVAVSGLGMAILVVIWAISEYNNAGGWPSQGFSQSSGIADVWNMWIVYPLMAWVFFVAADGWLTYLRKPITESQIKREIERQTGGPMH